MKIDMEKLTADLEKIWKQNKFDPNGSYIGNSKIDKEPAQDQDDL